MKHIQLISFLKESGRVWCVAAALVLLVDVSHAEALRRAEGLLDKLPLSFELNKGQFDRRVKFLSRGYGQKIFLTDDGMVVGIGNGASIGLEFQERNTETSFEGLAQLEEKTNYFIADDSSPFNTKSFTDIPNFGRVLQKRIYPGIDVAYYGSERQLEYDLIVAPGADTGKIRIRIKGHEKVSVAESGDLIVSASAGELTLKRPFAYQEMNGSRVIVPASYFVQNDEIRFRLAAYDRSRALVIDPLISYSTLIGGNGGYNDSVYSVVTDDAGAVYIAGETSNADFPTVNAYQTQTTGRAAFVSKLNASGTGFVYSTFISGSRSTSGGRGVAVDAARNAYVVGETDSSFPVTKGAYQTRCSSSCAFVAKLGPQGNTLLYATYVSGVQWDSFSHPIAVDTNGNAYISGLTAVDSFVPTAGAFQSTRSGFWDAIVVKLNTTGTGAVYATFLGGAADEKGYAIAVDAAGNAYVTGYTTSLDFPVLNSYQSTLPGVRAAFVTKFGPTGALLYSTYLGGTGSDEGLAIAVDSLGQAHVAGRTNSNNFPVAQAFQPVRPAAPRSAFITKMAVSGDSLLYSSFYGGPSASGGGDASIGVQGIAVDAAGNVYMAGYTSLVDGWPQVDAIMTDLVEDGWSRPFVAKIQEVGSPTLTFSTLFALAGQQRSSLALALAIDPNANIYVVGRADRLVPTTPGAMKTNHGTNPSGGNDENGFIFKITPGRFSTRLFSSDQNPTNATTITLSALVTNTQSGGTVTFNSDGTVLATVPVSGGGATFTATLPVGVHRLDAVYSGDGKPSRPLFLPVKQALMCN